MFLLAIAEALARGKRQLWGHPTGFIEKNPAASWTLGCVRSGGGRGVEAAWPSGEGVGLEIRSSRVQVPLCFR